MTLSGAIDKITNNYVYPRNATKDNEYKCPDCKQDLILKKGIQLAAHFAHKSDSKCTYHDKPNESQIHKDAKLQLKYIIENKIPLTILRKCYKCEHIDEYKIPLKINEISHIVEEFTLNPLDKYSKKVDLFYRYRNNYDDYGINYIFEICHTHKTKEDTRPEPWYEINATKLINTIQLYFDNNLTKIELNCIREIKCITCSKKNNGVIYFNQRGAGCGKTYESIQLLQKDDRFKSKTTFIYLTQMHSAKEVIYNEFKNQQDIGLLSNLTELKQQIDIEKYQYKINQYKFSFHNIETKKDITIIIGTIDSFAYAVYDKSKLIVNRSYFVGIIKTICEGYFHTNINYAQYSQELNESCLIIIDEAQDLGPEYIDAFNMIIKDSDIDVYIIGDKLQSITYEHNIFTYIDKKKIIIANGHSTQIIHSNGKNQVMRFHNTQFKDFVNTMIPYKKYNLPSITDICNIKCKYVHENNIKPYNIFEIPVIYSNDYDYPKIHYTINKIIHYMNIEIETYNYLPHNFMFIFPILARNTFANMLEARIQDFWINKFNDINYQDNVLKNNKIWKNDINNNNFYKYVYLHKSTEGKSINLAESAHATRILSIHASKGNGCEVVFLLGMSENSLSIFSNNKKNLIYDSLLHVAITRQKKSLYIGITKNNDDIRKRLLNVPNLDIQEDNNLEPIITHIKCTNKYSKLIDYVKSDNNLFNEIYENIIEKNNYIKLLPKSNKNNTIIDFGHHMIRYSVFIYNIMSNIFENEITNTNQVHKDQFFTILNKISKKIITIYKYDKYNEKLKNISDNNRKQIDTTEIPILQFDVNDKTQYYEYTIILKAFMENIKEKLRKSLNGKKLPLFCSLESIILLFMIKINDNGIYSDITIMDIYSIIYSYNQCSYLIDTNHTENFNCICNIFKKIKNCTSTLVNSEIESSINNHYKFIEQINETYNNYKTIIIEKLKLSALNYNINLPIKFGNPNFSFINEFNIIAYSETHVIHFIIKPQFNKLNFNDIIYDGIFENYLISNAEKYNDKKIITCIFTFDSIEPIFYELNIDKNNIIIKDCIKRYLIYQYSEYHTTIFKFYNYWVHKRKEEISLKQWNSIVLTYNKLREYKCIPDYIPLYFDRINQEYENNKDNKNNILLKVNDEDVFIKNIQKLLENSIDNFLNVEKKIDEEDDF